MKVGEQQNHRAFQGRAFAAERHIQEGDVCALTCMELTPTFQRELVGTAAGDAERLNPLHGEIFRNVEAQYYWSSFPMRMGHRCTVAAGDSGTLGAADVASRPAALLPSGYPAILRSAHSLGGHGTGAFLRGNHDQPESTHIARTAQALVAR